MKTQLKNSATSKSYSSEFNSGDFNRKIQNPEVEEPKHDESLFDMIFSNALELNKLKDALNRAQLSEAEKLKRRLIGSKKVCELLKISDRTLKTWRKEGIIPFIKIGKNVYYNPGDLEEKLEKNYNGKRKL
jgi:hypothetical protein